MLEIKKFSLFRQYSHLINQGVTTRRGGVSPAPFDSLNVRYGIGDTDANVEMNRKVIADLFEIWPTQIYSANQTHSDNIFVVSKDENPGLTGQGEIDDTDAIICAERGVALMIQVADCQGIIIFDPAQKVIAAIHAGWKGLLKNIVPKTIKKMEAIFGCRAADMIAGISPSLGPCCSEFIDREYDFPQKYRDFFLANHRVDLWGICENQLLASGMARSRIENMRVCTSCHSDQYFSYRQNHETGRFGVIIAG